MTGPLHLGHVVGRDERGVVEKAPLDVDGHAVLLARPENVSVLVQDADVRDIARDVELLSHGDGVDGRLQLTRASGMSTESQLKILLHGANSRIVFRNDGRLARGDGLKQAGPDTDERLKISKAAGSEEWAGQTLRCRKKLATERLLLVTIPDPR